MPETPPTQEEKPGFFSRALEKIAYPFSALIGLSYGYSHTRRSSYENLRNLGAFAEARKARQESFDKLLPAQDTTKDIRQQHIQNELVYDATVERRFKDLGYKNIWDRFLHLEKSQKFEAVMTAFTAAGISLGILLTITNNRDLLERLTHKGKERKKDEPDIMAKP